MATVFKSPYTDSVMWSLQGGVISLIGANDEELLSSNNATTMLAATEQIQISTQRQVTTRTPLVGNTSIKIATPPTGTCDLTTLIGPQHVIDEFIKIFGDSCHTFKAVVRTSSTANKMC